MNRLEELLSELDKPETLYSYDDEYNDHYNDSYYEDSDHYYDSYSRD